MAQFEAFYVLAVPGAGQQHIKRKVAVVENSAIFEPLEHSCVWQQPPSVDVTPRWALFTEDCRHALEKQKRSPRPHAKSQCCSITACAMAWHIMIPVPHNMRNAIAAG